MATDYETLIPSGIADQAIAGAEQESVVLTLGKVIRMRAGVESIPVVSIAPSVGFVSPAYGGRKPITQVEWSVQRDPGESRACQHQPCRASSDDRHRMFGHSHTQPGVTPVATGASRRLLGRTVSCAAGSAADAWDEPAADESPCAHQHRDERTFENVVVREPVHVEPLGDHDQDDEAEYTSDDAPEHRHGNRVALEESRSQDAPVALPAEGLERGRELPIESTLSRVYRKPAIRWRTELARRLSEASPQP
jgi:hypothetical protein